MSPSSSSVGVSSKVDVFGIGEHEIKVVKVAEDASTPRPLLIFTPSEAGEFPVLVLLHGFLLYNSFYSQLSHHIASHGFILVVPQLYSVTGPDATKEIECVVAISNWLPEGLQKFLPSGVHADLTKLGLAGHSRGGKVAFAVALNKLHTKLNSKFSALIGIDPVDGMDMGKQTQPKVLTYVPHSFNLEIPVMVIGSGLGEIRKNPLFPACAPKGVNHEDFYNECCKPACYFVVKDYGHLDMLDDETKGIRGKVTHCLCKNGKSREPMRRFVGVAVVAFLKAYLEGDCGYLTAIKDEANGLVVLQKVDFQL
ncbi:chlorophyllase-2, chloroplastic-like [Cynara cardunculus var. scolymus]|uniref:chlorophyllase n=1 Tax=Cynara cardunculus var. scolymus TaxID=59895 RepID=A0A103YMI4_CYNCS|nr:chlorophyllase-2, chloroplastic-like [Cynara cardunculus var. scolymus]KVI11783.1 Chlorophyllase [Cynara cardunculus var. scolymus]